MPIKEKKPWIPTPFLMPFYMIYTFNTFLDIKKLHFWEVTRRPDRKSNHICGGNMKWLQDIVFNSWWHLFTATVEGKSMLFQGTGYNQESQSQVPLAFKGKQKLEIEKASIPISPAIGQ